MAGGSAADAGGANWQVDLNLGLIGNGQIAALIDSRARVVWACFPDFHGDPMFCRLVDECEQGFYELRLEDCVETRQQYLRNTAIVQTWMKDKHGAQILVTDFAPRFKQFGRSFRPMTLVRQVFPLAGTPRVRVRLRPVCQYGGETPRTTRGSNHIRYVAPAQVLRLTTDVPVAYVLDERPFVLTDPKTLILAPDESLSESPYTVGRRFFEQTRAYWLEWVRGLAVPYDWQAPVIRAAITLKLSTYSETGAVVAAMTTSVPEAAHTQRNWDYRHCWLRDAHFVVQALNRLSATRTMEDYLHYIVNLVARMEDEPLKPVYGIGGETDLPEWTAPDLTGYRGMGPVRIGNAAHRQIQHDVYGSVILAATQIFFDERLRRMGDESLFRQLEPLGEKALANFSTPDAGIWEYRGRTRVHTYSALLCWVACNRLARIATHLNLARDGERWGGAADTIHETICEQAWDAAQNCFVESFGGKDIDASLLLLHDLGFLAADDPRFIGTVEAVERVLRSGDHLFRYAAADDFGEPGNAFNICTFWFIDALAATGREEEARELFENMLAHRNPLGLLSEHTHPGTGELWGNFPQTYSMVGIISSARRLSRRWEDVL